MKPFRRAFFIWGWPLLALSGLFWLSLFCYSPIPISPLNALHALLAPESPSLAEALVLNLRLPRSLVAVMLGASLAMSGALLQTLTHNPLASPSLLGINSGAALAMALTSAFSPAPLAGFSLALIAACGGGISWLLVMSAGGGWRQQQDRQRLILAGIALSALCMALTRMTLLLAEDRAWGILTWLAGGVSHVRWAEFWQLFPFVALITPGVFLLASALNLLNVSDTAAHSLGVNLPRLRLLINVAVLLLTGASVSVAGPIAFVGLLVPHLARFWAGHDHRTFLPVSALLGALFMLLADMLARALAWPGELPAARCWRWRAGPVLSGWSGDAGETTHRVFMARAHAVNPVLAADGGDPAAVASAAQRMAYGQRVSLRPYAISPAAGGAGADYRRRAGGFRGAGSGYCA